MGWLAMYGNTLLFVTCFFHLVKTQIPAGFSAGPDRNLPKDNGNNESRLGRVWSNDVINCIDDDDVGDCIRKALDRAVTKLNMIRKLSQLANVTTDANDNSFGIKDLVNLLGDFENKIQKRINEEIKGFKLKDIVDIKKNFTLGVTVSKNETRNFQLIVKSMNGRSVTERKHKFNMGNVLYYLLIPALAMAGIMPWILPQIKMVAMVIMAMNQMAFSMGAVSLIRGLIFDVEPQEHIIYVNSGYKKEYYQKAKP
ncbi:uncharacterized protein LOC112904512 [Agrilus planipennis]|uniref:Uncharacterized protein LOC112904512 n=1 Tax=Agrilus planipennis TaxID=224129 RepID=A0A7F5QYU3_AGRPL|nr:uncharacterized protein LOC112904512 [Agrilus planipennis]XP_025830437.1 uncharacterized protein LOC112904512 [Agrilus planipennis]